MPALLSAIASCSACWLNGVPVEYQKDGETRGDFCAAGGLGEPDANAWLAVNQFGIKNAAPRGGRTSSLFINWPPAGGAGAEKPGRRQRRYLDGVPDSNHKGARSPISFHYNELMGFRWQRGAPARCRGSRERFLAVAHDRRRDARPAGQFKRTRNTDPACWRQPICSTYATSLLFG